MKIEIKTGAAPAAIGPYSQAIASQGFIFVSGQLGLDPKSQELCNSSVETEARRALDNMRAVLEAAGSSMDAVVKTTLYLADIGDFAAVNSVYAGYFGDPAPARATLQAGALPLGARVEIDAVARAK